MSVLTVDEARAYTRDYESTDMELLGYIDFAEEYIKNAVGESVDLTSARVKLLAGMLVTDANETRTTTAEQNSRSLLVTSLITQLKAQYGSLEMEVTGIG